MCYFITIGLPTNSVSVLDEFRHEYHIEDHTNTSIKKAFGPQYEMFTITGGGCSCSLYSPAREEHGKQEEKLRAKYTKKGWSQGKIDRAITDKAHALHHKFNGLHPGLRHNLSRMFSVSKHLLVLVHHYSGDIETESINVASKIDISVSDLLANNAAVPEDTLIQLQA